MRPEQIFTRQFGWIEEKAPYYIISYFPLKGFNFSYEHNLTIPADRIHTALWLNKSRDPVEDMLSDTRTKLFSILHFGGKTGCTF